MCENDKLVSEQKPTPWGFWATMGFSCVIGMVYFLIQVIVVALFFAAAMIGAPEFNIDKFCSSLQANGLFLATATCAAAPFTIVLMVIFAKIRGSITVKEYLCLRWVGWKELFKWSLIVILLAGIFDTLTFLLDRPIVTKFMVDTYTTAYFVPFLWFAFIIVAPLTEELFFRGFLFKGIEHSRIGAAGAVVITSLLWSVMHIQYDIYGITNLFISGLLLGLARVKSNSIYVPVVMHILQNIIATVETVIYLRMTANAV